MMRHNDCITLENCKHGFLYLLAARNLSLGVYDEGTKGFIGVREKFRRRYLDVEFHWDTGEPFGTASPIKELDKLPAGLVSDNDSVTLYKWLEEAERRFKQLV